MTPTAAANGRREDTLTLPLRGSVAAACEACAERVAAELRALPGVRQTAVEENSGALRVDFDPAAVSPDRLSERARAAADALAARYDHRSYRIGGMDCANCALSIEKSVQSLPGVTTARVNFPAARLKVEQERAEDGGDATDAVIRDRVRALGFSLTGGATTATTATTATAATAPDHAPDTAARPSWRDGLPLYLSGAFLALGLVLEYALAGRVPEAAANAAFALSIVLGGHRFGLAGLRALLTGTLGTNLLMALAAAGAVYLGEWGEAAMVVFLYALGEHLERGAMERARRSLKELIDAAPATAERLLADGSTEIVAAESLEVGERVLVKPGAKLPADGVITAGASGDEPVLPPHHPGGDHRRAAPARQGDWRYRLRRLRQRHGSTDRRGHRPW